MIHQILKCQSFYVWRRIISTTTIISAGGNAYVGKMINRLYAHHPHPHSQCLPFLTLIVIARPNMIYVPGYTYTLLNHVLCSMMILVNSKQLNVLSVPIMFIGRLHDMLHSGTIWKAKLNVPGSNCGMRTIQESCITQMRHIRKSPLVASFTSTVRQNRYSD